MEPVHSAPPALASHGFRVPPANFVSTGRNARVRASYSAASSRKMVSTSRAKMYQAPLGPSPRPPPELSLSCGSKVIREIIARKEGGAWERG